MRKNYFIRKLWTGKAGTISKSKHKKRSSLFFLVVCFLFIAASGAFGQTAQVINVTGGTDSSDGLKIQVNTGGNLAVYRYNQAQYCCAKIWPEGATGGVTLNFRFSQESTYNTTARSFTACSTTPVQQVGNTYTTSVTGYVQSTISSDVFYITMNVTYIYPNKYFLVDYHVRAPSTLSAANQTVHLYLSHDAYISGKDGSRSYRAINTTGELVGNYRLSNDAGSCTGGQNNQRYPSTHGFKTKNGFRSYYTGFYNARNTIGADLKLTNTYNGGANCIDDGIAVEFTLGPFTSAGQTLAKQVMHGYGDNQGEFDNTPVDDPTVSPIPSSSVNVQLTSTAYSEPEGDADHTTSTVKLRVSGGTLNQAQVCNFTVSGGSAVQNTDYTYVKGFTIPAGDYTTPQEFVLNNITIKGNTICQNDRTFHISIDYPEYCNDLIEKAVTNQSAIFTIVDDEPRPTITNTLPNHTYQHGQVVPAIAFVADPGTATIAWTNSNTSIGLVAGGNTTMPSFTATNNGTTPITATITVTPTLSCSGTPKTFTITVNPKPTITYHYNGGTPPAILNPTSYTYGPAITIANEPTRLGYTFAGWTCPELSVTTPTKPFVIPANTASHLNLYADWGAGPDAYTINYNLGGGIVIGNTNPTTYDVTTPSFSLKNPVRTGYTFLGWTGTDLGGNTMTVTIPKGSTGNRTYIANWSENTYNITYNFNNGAAPATPNKATYKISEVPFSINTTVAANQPARTGYDFAGWTGQDIMTPAKTINVTTNSFSTPGEPEPLNYLANWTPINYTITYALNGGIASNLANYNAETPSFTLNNPTRAGYTFAGWTGTGLGGATTTVTIPVGSTGNRTYTASWMPVNYTLTYVDNDGVTVITAPGAPATYNDTQLPKSFTSTPVKAGWTFVGWTGVGVSGNAVTIPAGTLGNLTYQAVWTADLYTITFNPAGGTNPTIPSNCAGYNITNLPINNVNPVPTRVGYTFKGWTGHGLPGTTAPFNITSAMPGVPGNLNFIADWALNSYTITYHPNGGIITPGNPSTYDVTVLPLNIATEPTHLNPRNEFIGWTCQQLASEPMQLIFNIPANTTGNLDMDAHWSKDLDDLNPSGVNDTLFVCEGPKKLNGDPQGKSWDWIFPDGSRQTSRDVSATLSGRYVCNTNYGTKIVSDTIHVYLLMKNNSSSINRITTTGAKIGRPQQFVLDIPLPMLPYTTASWNVSGGGTIIKASNDSLTAVWNSTGEKTISVHIGFNYGGINCTKTISTKLILMERSLGFFVDQTAADGRKDGTSWENAYLTVQDALSNATVGDHIWVAKGTYKPVSGRAYEILQDSIEVYGGFNGTEEYLYERDIEKYPTTLNGNGSSVFTIKNSSDVRIDGFTIQGGKADNGSGIIFENGSSGTVAYCIIKGNTSTSQGGGIHTSAPWYGYPVSQIINSEISGNQAKEGAGIYNNGGDIRILNATISGNKAEIAGGIYNDDGNPAISNTIIWGNQATKGNNLTKDIVNSGGSPIYTYSIIGGSKNSEGKWNNAIGRDSTHNKDVSPLFRHSGFEKDGVTMRKGNYRLSSSSVAVDAGNNQAASRGIYVPWDILLEYPNHSEKEGLIFDLDHNERIYNDRVDIGAYELGASKANFQINRPVRLPEVEGLITIPGPGVHMVVSHQDFIFTVIAKPGYSLDYLSISTGIPSRDKDGIIMKKNADGSVKVTIRQVWEPLDISINGVGPVSNSTIESHKIWAYRQNLHIKARYETMIQIYTLDGKLHTQRMIESGETTIPLSQGFYTIVIDGRIFKIMID